MYAAHRELQATVLAHADRLHCDAAFVCVCSDQIRREIPLDN
jgi:hypothetical protein